MSETNSVAGGAGSTGGAGNTDDANRPRNFRIERRDGLPYLVFEWRGHQVVHSPDQTKDSLFARGLANLGPGWRDRVPPILIYDGYGRPVELRGWTRDPDVLSLVAQYIRFCNTWEDAPPRLTLPKRRRA
jgi:hypothetical protein